MEKKVYQGELSIIRTNKPDTVIVIELEDKISGTQVVSIELSPEQFGLAITGKSLVHCTFQHYAQNLCMKPEHKEEIVPVRDAWNLTPEDEASALAPFEVDGWVARMGDMGNRHRIVRDKNAFRVVFFRFVQPE